MSIKANINSKLLSYYFENYILRSILEKEDSLVFSYDDNYVAKILRQTLSNENKQIEKFDTKKDVQKFLGEKHDELKPIFQSAYEQELSELIKSLHGYELKLYGDYLKRTDKTDKTKKEDFKRETGVQIPKELFEDESFKMIIVDENGGYELITSKEGTDEYETFYVYDLLIPSFSYTYINRINNKKFSIIVITNNISIDTATLNRTYNLLVYVKIKT